MDIIYRQGSGMDDHPLPLPQTPTAASSSSSSSKGERRMSGELKHQCLDENNMYEWIRKKLLLRIQDGVLEMSLPSVTQEEGEMMKESQVSLGGAKEAKAWSSTTSQAVKEAIQCSMAMAEVHRAVDDTVSKSQEDLRGTILRLGGTSSNNSMGVAPPGHNHHHNNNNPLLPPRPPSGQGLGMGQGLNESDCITVEEDFQSPLHFLASRGGGAGGGAVYSGERTVPRYERTKNREKEQHHHHHNHNQQHPLNLSAIPTIGSTSPSQTSTQSGDDLDSARGLGPENKGSQTHSGSKKNIKFETSPSPPSSSQRLPTTTSTESSSSSSSSVKLGRTSRGGGGGESAQRIESSTPPAYTAAVAVELEALRLRVRQLTDTVDDERAQAESAREEVVRLQADLDAANQAMVKQSEMMRVRERDAYQAFLNDMHVKIAKAVNDRDSLHEAALRSAEEPLKREIMHLREELTEERKRFGEKVSHESRLRDAAEGREGELQRECARLRDAHGRLTRDLARAAETTQSDAASWSKEREALIASAEERISSLETERDHITSRGQIELRSRIKELTERFQATSQEAQKQIRMTVEQEMLAERVRVLGSMEKQCLKDIEKARTDERQHAARELEATKRSFAEREAHTTRDLIELEKLHDARVKRLESQLSMAKKRAAEARDQVDVLNRQMSLEANNSKSIHGKYYQELEGNAHRADQLATELQAVHGELQEVRAREASYRAQLARILEDARVKNAELLEFQRQAADGGAQALHWRRAIAAKDATHAQTTTALEITRGEVALLEHELRRVKMENLSLQSTLEKTEQQIYGLRGNPHRSSTGGDFDGFAMGSPSPFGLANRSGIATATGVRASSVPRGGVGIRGRSASPSMAAATGSRTRTGVSTPWRFGMCNCRCRGETKCKCKPN